LIVAGRAAGFVARLSMLVFWVGALSTACLLMS
jgi:hypothetical protein